MQIQKHLFLVFMLTSIGLSGCAQKVVQAPSPVPQEGEVVPLVGNLNIHSFVLSNGLRLLVVEDHSSPTLAYQTWFRVGSHDEVPNYTGLAHLFEHMMFKGTKAHKEGEYFSILEHAGGEGVNAFTDHDYTAYVQEMPNTQLELAASMESDRMVNLVVNDEAFKTELQVVQNERRFRTENNPDGTIEQNLFGLAFKSHSYHWPVIGYQEDLDRMSAEDARAFYVAHYNPSHATIIVAGDVNPEATLAVIKKYYGAIPANTAPVPAVTPEPMQKEARRQNIKLNIQVEKLAVAYRVPSINDPEAPALEVLSAILSGGKSSRLHRALVETGIASSIEANSPDNKDDSLFVISSNLQKGKKAAQAEAAIQREINRILHEPVSEKELERARNRMSYDYYTSLSSNGERARFLGYFEATANSFKKGIEFRKAVQEVTPEQVQKAAQHYFVSQNRTVLTASPKGAE